MGIFDKKTALQKEQEKLSVQEQNFLQKRMKKKDFILNQKLAKKVPPKLQSTLDAAFMKAFELVFEKGTVIIEKTYQKEKIEQDYQVSHYASKVKQDRKTLRSFSKKVKGTGTKNVFISGASGIGMGVLGIGLPDIPIFTGMILKDIYEIALHYGYRYDTQEEKYFILLIIKGAISYGEQLKNTDDKINEYIENEEIPVNYDAEKVMKDTAKALSKELLYIKFLQGIPVAGAVGGAFDAVYMQRITEYAGLKYKRRYLRKRSKEKYRY